MSWLFWAVVLMIVFMLSLGSVAFITLMERKVLSLTQLRLGPNKVTLLGLLQPVFDGVKLLSKQLLIPSTSHTLLISLSPSLMLGLFLFMWALLVSWSGQLAMVKYQSLLFFVMLSAGAYTVILTGWSSTSAFSKLGSLRGMLQSLSFEVVFIMLMMFMLTLLKSFGLFQDTSNLMDVALFWGASWLLLSLMESNRAPFDLLEGESELISGFNIEMGSLMFVYLFLSEYGMIMVLSLIASVFLITSFWLGAIMATLMLLIRSCYPRARYDSLMEFTWQSILPLITSLFIISMLL